MSDLSEVLRVEDVAELTGYKIGYLYQHMHEGKIPYYQPTGKVAFFRRSEIYDFIFQHKHKADYEIAAEAANRLASARPRRAS